MAHERKYLSPDNKYLSCDKKYFSFDKKYLSHDRNYLSSDKKYLLLDRKYLSLDSKYSSDDRKYFSHGMKYSSCDRKFLPHTIPSSLIFSCRMFHFFIHACNCLQVKPLTRDGSLCLTMVSEAHKLVYFRNLSAEPEDRITLPYNIKGRSLTRGKRRFSFKTVQESQQSRL